MAQPFKRMVPRPLPENATLEILRKPIPVRARTENGIVRWTDRNSYKRKARLDESGKGIVITEATWVDRNGNLQKAIVDIDDRRILVPDPNYYYTYTDENGSPRTRSSKTSDKAAASEIQNKAKADAALRRRGIIDSELDGISQQARRLIESHLSDYEAKLRAENCTDDHIKRTLRMIRSISRSADFTIASDMRADGVNRYVEKMKKSGKSLRTIQSYLTAIKGFTRWLANQHKLPRDPLSSVRKPNPEIGRVLVRRILLHQEWEWLYRATSAGPVRHGIVGKERALLYATAIQTGLRSGELRSLACGDLHLDREPPYVACQAEATKNGKKAQQFIRQSLAKELIQHTASTKKNDRVFKMPHETNVARMLRKDLGAARLAWLKEAEEDSDEYVRRLESDFLATISHEEKSLDFHSLRHTCGAWLAMAGAHPKTVQTVLRHSSIQLTMDRYGHLFPGQLADAVARLPEMV